MLTPKSKPYLMIAKGVTATLVVAAVVAVVMLAPIQITPSQENSVSKIPSPELCVQGGTFNDKCVSPNHANGKYLCGPSYPNPLGGEGQCNPTSEYPCCSMWGWCGNTGLHCQGIDYRTFYNTPPAFAPADEGFCVRPDGTDENEGVVKLADGDFKTEESRKQCLIMCAAYSRPMGCEMIWDQENRGCYVHTSTSITRGNAVPNHLCAIDSWKRAREMFAPVESGFCVRADGTDENTGVIKLAEGDYQSENEKMECAYRCAGYTGPGQVTGCETIYGQYNRGCYVHTSPLVSRGNSVSLHSCWIVKSIKSLRPQGEAGFCVRADGSDENDGVFRLTTEDTDTPEKQQDCLRRCAAVAGFTGCEAIWNQSNRGCYAHTSTRITRGNNVPNHNCWIKTN